jgi:hypothetical protein
MSSTAGSSGINPEQRERRAIDTVDDDEAVGHEVVLAAGGCGIRPELAATICDTM